MAIGILRGKGDSEFVTGLHSLDMGFKFWENTLCAVDIVQRPFFCCMVNDVAVNFEFVDEFNYFVLAYFHSYN